MRKIFSLILLILSLTTLAKAQQIDPEKLQAAVDSETFVFDARQASGMSGRMIQLDPGYTLQVTPEKVVGNLPFFGRSYQGNPGSDDGGLKFEFSEFDFLIKPKKKGGWEITIEPTETSDVRSVFLTVQKNGSASLRVISNSKQGMSYNGYIKE